MSTFYSTSDVELNLRYEKVNKRGDCQSHPVQILLSGVRACFGGLPSSRLCYRPVVPSTSIDTLVLLSVTSHKRTSS